MVLTAQHLQMAVPRDPTSAEIAQFLSTRSADQMLHLMQSIKEPVAQVALTTSMLLAPSKAPVRTPSTEKPRKALNAFVGFRCYYIPIPIFKPWPMKKLSNPMGVMWESDPNKSLWSLMAKAWSIIRDQIGKDKAPLDQFFQIICPYLNIPSPETYLERHGWELVIGADGSPSLSRNYAPSSDLCGAGIVNMALSVEDIIIYCQSMGYAQEYTPQSNTDSPTFLAHPHGHAITNNSTLGLQMQTADPVHTHRVAARNKRRTKRQNAKNTGVVPMLQQQIIDAHITETASPPQYDDSAIFLDTSAPFYGDLSDLLTVHAMVDYQPHDQSSPSESVDMNQTAMAGWTDWGAFRTGADENVTLPFFDPTFM